MLQHIKEKAISLEVYNIFRRLWCIWSIILMSFIDLQQTVFQFPLKHRASLYLKFEGLNLSIVIIFKALH